MYTRGDGHDSPLLAPKSLPKKYCRQRDGQDSPKIQIIARLAHVPATVSTLSRCATTFLAETDRLAEVAEIQFRVVRQDGRQRVDKIHGLRACGLQVLDDG